MGILLDPDFTFQPHLEKTLAKWSQAFDKLVGACLSQGLPFLFTATIVPERVESVALYGLAFCIGVPSAESTLNRMQANWARTLQGIKESPHGFWPFLIAECRWRFRLGTRMLSEAVMLETRILLLPPGMSAHRALLTARLSEFSSWAKLVAGVRHKLGLPDVLDWAKERNIVLDPTCRRHCKNIARRYRSKVLYPALSNYDQNAYLKAEQTSQWPYPDFQRQHDTFSDSLLFADW